MLALCTLMLSCASGEEFNSVKTQSTALIDALIADDYESAHKIVSGVISEDEFKPVYDEMKAYISDVESYTLTQTGWYSSFDNGVSYVKAVYKMETNADTYEVTVMAEKGKEGLVAFNINRVNSDSEKVSQSVEA